MIPSVSQQPSVNLTLWHIVKILGDYHLVGEPVNRADGGPRITSPIAEIDLSEGWARTASGREYRLFEGATVPSSDLKNRFLRGYCVRHGLVLDDVELTDFQEVELAFATSANRLKV
jgi:hypothetical protein